MLTPAAKVRRGRRRLGDRAVGEENFNQYFLATGTTPQEARYGLGPTGDERGWWSVDPRWDATSADHANQPSRFGWIVEVDPARPSSTPVKHTAMGRFKHEGANVIVAADGHVVAYTGDDERFDYVYRFVSRDTLRQANGPSQDPFMGHPPALAQHSTTIGKSETWQVGGYSRTPPPIFNTRPPAWLQHLE